MNERRRYKLRQRYLSLGSRYDERLEQWPCGRQLAEVLDSNLYGWRCEMEAIETEVLAAIPAKGETA